MREARAHSTLLNQAVMAGLEPAIHGASPETRMTYVVSNELR